MGKRLRLNELLVGETHLLRGASLLAFEVTEMQSQIC